MTFPARPHPDRCTKNRPCLVLVSTPARLATRPQAQPVRSCRTRASVESILVAKAMSFLILARSTASVLLSNGKVPMGRALHASRYPCKQFQVAQAGDLRRTCVVSKPPGPETLHTRQARARPPTCNAWHVFDPNAVMREMWFLMGSCTSCVMCGKPEFATRTWSWSKTVSNLVVAASASFFMCSLCFSASRVFFCNSFSRFFFSAGVSSSGRFLQT